MNIAITCQPLVTQSHFYDIIKDFLVPATLAITAACVAYFIFVKETRRDRHNDEEKKKQERLYTLTYFSFLAKSIVKTAEQQNNYLNELIGKIENDDVEFHLLTYLPLDDLRRINQVVNLDEYLLAYTDYYKEIDRNTLVKEFKEIISCVDFFYFIFTEMRNVQQRALLNDEANKRRYQDLFYKGYNILADVEYALRSETTFHSAFLQITNTISANHKGNNYDLIFYQKYFFEPINELCVNYLDSGLPEIRVVADLAVITRDGKQAYLHIKSENQHMKAIVEADYKVISDAIVDLKLASERLCNNF